MYDIIFIGKNGVWYDYKINGLKISFNYLPTKNELIRAYEEYCNGLWQQK